MFWILSTLMALLVTAAVLAPLLRGGSAVRRPGPGDVDVYRQQLAEVDRDIDRGVLDPVEGDRTRTEIARRLLGADRAGATRPGRGPRPLTRAVAVVATLLIVGGGLGLYRVLGEPGYRDAPLAARLDAAERLRANRPSQAEAEAAAAAFAAAPVDAPEDYLAMIDQLREVVPTRPGDIDGWRLLARHEAALGNYAAAARAQAQVIEILGDSAAIGDHVRLVDLLVAAAGGFVSPETEALLTQILRRAPENPAARYYVGLLYSQTDRPDRAFRIWRSLVAEGPAADVHVRLARAQVQDAALRAGVEYRLPPEPSQPSAPGPSAPGPTADDLAAAAEMAPEARAEMVQGMVARLSERLATQGGAAADWARLISSLAVLGETERATVILQEAREAFSAEPEDLEIIEAAARQAGLDG